MNLTALIAAVCGLVGAFALLGLCAFIVGYAIGLVCC